MSDTQAQSREDFIPAPQSAIARTNCTAQQYAENYAQSLSDPDGFWAKQAKRIDG
jgi:acetyl-CoA synthetase